MTKNEFLMKFESEKLQTGEYLVVLDQFSESPLIIGCAIEQSVWKIYKTKERGGHYIIKEFDNEDDAYDYFYGMIYNLHKRICNQ